MTTHRLRALLSIAIVGGAALLSACDPVQESQPGTAAAPASAPATVAVDLIAINDFHGNLDPPGGTTRAADPHDPTKAVGLSTGGAAWLGGLIAQLKAANPHSFVVGAGDMFGASPIASNLYQNEPAVLALNAMGLDVSSVGNHEFDRGTVELQRMQNGGCLPGGDIGKDTCVDGVFPGAKYHYLAANVIDKRTGKPLFPAYEIRSVDIGKGRKLPIAFIGLVLKQAVDMVRPDGITDLSFTDEASAANALIPEIEAKGAKAIVVLIHQGGATTGLYDDQSCPNLSGDILPILDALDPAIRVVVSGHTHEAYVCRVKTRLLTSAGSYGRFVTDIKLGIDPATDTIVDFSAHNLPVINDLHPSPDATAYPAAPKDAAVAAIVDRYDALTAPLAQRKVGQIKADYSRMPNEDGESVLGDLIADAQLAAAPEAQIAFMNAGGIRENLLAAPGEGRPDGLVTYSDIIAVQPFHGDFVAMNLSGAQIMDLLESQHYETKPLRLLQVSQGFSYAWSRTAPAGQRIERKSIRIDGKPLVLTRSYRIVVNSFLANGGDGFSVLTQGTDRKLIASDDADVLEAYIRQHSPLMPKDRHRITRVP